MPVQLIPTLPSQGLSVFGTYDVSERQLIQYSTGRVNDDLGTTEELYFWEQHPLGLPAGVSVPIIVAPSGGGFRFSNSESSAIDAEPYASAGAIVVAPQYRSELGDSDDPVAVARLSGAIDLTRQYSIPRIRAILSARRDFRKFTSYIKQYPNRNFGGLVADSRRRIIYGVSTGGQIGIIHVSENSNDYLGMCAVISGMGLNFLDVLLPSETPTADLRSLYTEAGYPLDFPTLALGVADDPAIGEEWVTLWLARLALGTNNTVLYQPTGGHPGIDVLDDVIYDGNVVTAREASRLWMVDLMSGLSAQRPSKLVLS